jgi:hypothetical protein
VTKRAYYEVEKAFRNFSKWETYGLAYKRMREGKIALWQVQEIATRTQGIHPEIIGMRMRDFRHM